MPNEKLILLQTVMHELYKLGIDPIQAQATENEDEEELR